MNRFPVSPKPQRTVDGIVFDSKREAVRYGELKLLVRAGEIGALEIQPSYKVAIGGQHFCTYTADFRYVTNRGELVIEETKSTGTQKDAAYRLRKKAAELAYGFKVTEIVA